MCGILVIINKDLQPLNLQKCKKSLDYMYRRGPDWSIYKMVLPNVFMGQVVLSMTGKLKKDINLHYSESKNKFILFNGEIYNYKELANLFLKNYNYKKTSDTSILVNLFEKLDYKDANKKLDGMYAFVIYDQIKKSLLINRDIQGEKSLYIFEDNKKIIISSEINTIIHYNKSAELNINELKNYFYTRHLTQFDTTIFKNIRILLPGQMSDISLQNFKFKNISQCHLSDLISEKTYFKNIKKREEELVDELDSLLKKNIQQMIPIDRKFASVVSGGIDSSLVSALVCKYSKPNELISLNHVHKDEIAPLIPIFQQQLGNKINQYKIYLKDYYRNLVDAVKICNSPVHSHSFVGQLIMSQKISKNKCKAIFGGEGADELFGGYDTYRQIIKNPKKNYSNYTKLLNTNLFKKSNKEYRYFKKQIDINWKQSLDAYKFEKNLDHRNRLAMMLSDTAIQLNSNGLRGCDLMSMYYSIESRSIFLRKDIIRFALNLPLKFKINIKDENLMNTKILLKKVFLKYYNKDLIVKKQGFAGFPNEAERFLGKKNSYSFKKFFKINNLSNKMKKLDRATNWKIINTEMYLNKVIKKNKKIKVLGP